MGKFFNKTATIPLRGNLADSVFKLTKHIGSKIIVSHNRGTASVVQRMGDINEEVVSDFRRIAAEISFTPRQGGSITEGMITHPKTKQVAIFKKERHEKDFRFATILPNKS